MKIFLDDVRNAPGVDWVVCRTYDSFIRLVADCAEEGVKIDTISFDHDLGIDGPASSPTEALARRYTSAGKSRADFRNTFTHGQQETPCSYVAKWVLI